MSTIKNLVRSAGEDYIGYLTGFPAVSIATNLLGTALNAVSPFVKTLHPRFYLDWELRDWPLIYDTNHAMDYTYRGKAFKLPQVLIFDNNDLQLPLSSFSFSPPLATFELNQAIRAKTDWAYKPYRRMVHLRGQKYTPAENLRLTQITRLDDSVTLETQGVSYENYVRTNLVLDATIAGSSSLRSEIHRDHSLEPLNASQLANNLGVNILLLTADGQLVVQLRSRKVIVRPNEYCPSASGTFSMMDIPSNGALLSEISKLREALEELGISRNDVDQESIQLLGITRELIRGGQPEMFLFGHTYLTAEEFRVARNTAPHKYESRRLEFFDFGDLAIRPLDSENDRDQFKNLLDDCVDRLSSRMSIPLWTNLELWRQARLQ